MMRFKQMYEASYAGNIGFQEMAMFYRKASKKEIAEMENIAEQGDWEAFKDIIKRVLGVVLK